MIIVSTLKTSGASHTLPEIASQRPLWARILRGIRHSVVFCFWAIAIAPFAAQAQPETAKIVGLGATRCSHQFSADVRADPAIRRDYLAWAQGYMSGILVGRPPGTDTGLDLNPSTLGLLDQLKFLEDFCAHTPGQDFSDGVEALYKRLRRERRRDG